MENDPQKEQLTNRFLLILIVFIISGVLSYTIWYYTQNIFIISATPTDRNAEHVEIVQPAAPQDTSEWQIYQKKSKGYRFQYPQGWIVEERSGFLNSTHISPLGKEFEIIFSEGKIPYSFGRAMTTKKSLQVKISNENYRIEEVTIPDFQKIIDFALKHPSKELNVLIRTRTDDVNAIGGNIDTYEKQKQVIFGILSTIEYTNIKLTLAPEGFEEFNEFGFRLFYPRTLEITKKTDSEVAWGTSKMVLHSSSVKFPNLGTGVSIILDLSTNKIVTIGEILDKEVLFLGDIPADKLIFECGELCSYQIVRFTMEPTSYELIYEGTDEESVKQFNAIITAIRFE